MSAPIFFSVASGDVGLAERIFAHFQGGNIYLYSKSGENGAWIWKEIEEVQLPFAKALVVFWSAHFVKSEYTLRELRLARKFFDEGRLQDCVIIRLDDTQLIADPAGPELAPLHTEAIDLLSAFLGQKRSDPLKNVEAEARKLVSTLRDRVLGKKYPFQRRSVVQDQIEDAIDRDSATRFPALWLSGFNGNGRKTLAREMFRGLDRTVHEVDVWIDETSLPEQILMRIDSQYSGLMRKELAEMAENARNATPQDVAEAIERLAANNGYLMLQQSRLYEESVRLPEWVDETIAALNPGPLPKLVLITQLAPTDEQKLALEQKMAVCSVPPMTSVEATDFAWKIIRSVGQRNSWWNDEIVERVVEATDGKPDLIITVMQQASRLDRPEMIDQILGKEVSRFSETLTNVINYAMKQLEGDGIYKQILLFLTNISPVDRDDIEKFLKIQTSVSSYLTKLMDLSLVERSEAGLFRISPLLSNRLQALLIDPDIVASHRDSMREFASAGLEIDGDELGFFKIEAKI